MRDKIIGPYRRYDNWQIAALGASGNVFGGLTLRLLGTLRLWHDRWCKRRAMARDILSFNDAMFEDFSTSRAEAQKEVEKPFWRA
jgi:uncharacterized protein YjiS (DUF1127 family)